MQPVGKSTPAQVDYRRELVVQWHHQFYTVFQIAAALQVSPSVVTQDLKVRGIRLDRTRLRSAQSDPPPPTDWRISDPAKRVKTSIYSDVMALQWWQDTLHHSRENKALRRLAQDAKAADEAGDAGWFAEQHHLLFDLREYLGAMERCLDDPAFRSEAIRDSGRELSAANGSEVLKPSTDLAVKIWKALYLEGPMKFDRLMAEVGPHIQLDWARDRFTNSRKREPLSDDEVRNDILDKTLASLVKDGNILRSRVGPRPWKWADSWAVGRTLRKLVGWIPTEAEKSGKINEESGIPQPAQQIVSLP
jgi:hypothetical protein